LRGHDNDCTLNGRPARIVGWQSDFPSVAQINGPLVVEFSWSAINSVMSKNRSFVAT
jgi:hypothetical protein